MRKVNSASIVNQRTDERVRAELPLHIQKTYWNKDGIESIDTIQGLSLDKGLSLDISNGGIAFYMNPPASAGEILELSLPKLGRAQPFSLRGEVCWQRDAEKGSSFRHVIGVHFILDNKTERDRIIRYVSSLAGSQG